MKSSIDRTIIDKTSAWPFVEAKKFLEKENNILIKKIK